MLDDLTLSPLPPPETDETDITDFSGVSNRDFLSAVFGTLPGEGRPVVVSFAGNPGTVPKSDWFGKSWSETEPDLPPDHNCYFSLAAFRPDEAGQYRRRKAQFSVLYAIMLDDVGTKVPLERLELEASWMIETSRGNFQAGYILAEPLTNAAEADRLMKAIIAANLCDPGASGPTARLARLPVGVNGKHDPAFQCRLVEWNPGLRYSVEDLVFGFDLDLRQPGRPKAERRETAQADGINPEDAELFTPRPDENPVIAALKTRGFYKTPLGGGRHDTTCPWRSEHTGGVDSGTAYFEPSEDFPSGGLKCQHGHCDHRHIRDLLAYLEVPPAAARMKPTLRLLSGELHRIAFKAEQELAKAGRYYQRGGLIVVITTDPGTRNTFVKDIRPPALLGALCAVAIWERFDKRARGFVRVEPSDRLISVIFHASEYRHLLVLNGLAHQPYLRLDGSLVLQAGYDAATGMFGVFNARAFSVPENPTRADAKAALVLLQGLLAEFVCADVHDRAAALAAILTATIRASLPFAPMFHIRAPQISSGKSFLCQIITAFATPRRGAPATFPQDDEECRKFLLAELLTAPMVIEFDNLTSDLIAHKSLCTALTSEHMTGRILGVSKTATVGTRALFLSSGNNVGPVADMTRRCITINLDPGCETPAARQFRNPNVLNDLLRERGKYVSAALTIIRAWITAGRPATECKPLATYGEWSDLCRQPLLWLGLADPAQSVFAAMTDDPERETLGRLLHAWQANFGSTPTMVRTVVNQLFGTVVETREVDELREILTDIAGDKNSTINRRILGRWLKRHERRIVEGLRLVRASGTRSAEAWGVESVSSV